MSMQLVSFRDDRVTVDLIGNAIRKVVSKPDRIHSRSHNNTTLTFSCPIGNIHEDDLGYSKKHHSWTAEYRVRQCKTPTFTMSTVGTSTISSTEHVTMQAERKDYLEGLATEICAALDATPFDTSSLSVQLHVEYGTLTISIDLFGSNY